MDELGGESDFWGEAQDLVDALGHTLLQLGQQAADAQLPSRAVDAMFRDAHTLKSLFRLLDCHQLGSLANAVEDTLEDLRRDRAASGPATRVQLLRAVEAMAASCARAQAGAPIEEPSIDAALASLAALRPDATGQLPRASAVAQALRAEGEPVAQRAAAGTLAMSPLERHRLAQSEARGDRVLLLALLLPLAEMATAFDEVSDRLQPFGDVLASVPSTVAEDDEVLRFDLRLALRDPAVSAGAVLAALAPLAVAWLTEDDGGPDQQSAPPAPAAAGAGAAGPVAQPAAPAPATAAEPIARQAQEPAASGAERQATERQASEATIAQTVRVDIRRLDRLMHWVGELTLTKLALQELSEALRELPQAATVAMDVLRESESLERRLAALRSGLMQVRMVPIGQLFERLVRAGQQAAHELGKEVRFSTHGEATEIDKYIAEKLVDPMMHLVRNAVDHGIERPEARRAAGKPRHGTVQLLAKSRGSQVVVQAIDDGAGIDLTSARETAVRHNLVSKQAAPLLSDEQVYALLSQPGFSTRRAVSAYSGRGVGLDVAKTELEQLGGALEVSAIAGQGATFSLVTPVTLAIVPSMIVATAGELYALPLGHVAQTLSYLEADTFVSGERRMLRVEGRVMPLLELAATFRLGEGALGNEASRGARGQFVVVVGIAQKRLALLVDDLIAQQDIVIKSLGPRLAQVSSFAGAAELASRRLVLVLNTLSLLNEAGEEPKWHMQALQDGMAS